MTPLQKCQWQKSQFYHTPMQSFRDFKLTYMTYFLSFQRTPIPWSGPQLLLPIWNLHSTIISSICLLSTYLSWVFNILAVYYYLLQTHGMHIVLDPCISYKKLYCDFEHDAKLLADLEKAKHELCVYYDTHYASCKSHNSQDDPSTSSRVTAAPQVPGSPPRESFMARYKDPADEVTHQLNEYFKLSPERFDSCDPLEWWQEWQKKWPQLYQLACHILAIPGEQFSLILEKNLSMIF